MSDLVVNCNPPIVLGTQDSTISQIVTPATQGTERTAAGCYGFHLRGEHDMKTRAPFHVLTTPSYKTWGLVSGTLSSSQNPRTSVFPQDEKQP